MKPIIAVTVVAIVTVASLAVPCPTFAQAAFDNAVFLSAGATPEAVAIGDLDGDGWNDLAVVNFSGDLHVLFNRGDGTFDPAVAYPDLWATSVLDVKMADLDRDGDRDLAVAFFRFQGGVSVVFNRGDGTFDPPVEYDSCYSTQGIAVGDLNGDLHADIAGMSNCFRATVLLNDGSAGLVHHGDFGNGYVPGGISMADLDGDSDNDVVYANQGVSTLTVLFNDGSGTLQPFTQYDSPGSPQEVALGDFDGDGDVDIAAANLYGPDDSAAPDDFSLLRNDGTGRFAPAVKTSLGREPEGLVAADFDLDGDLDVAAANRGGNNLTFRWNAGNGTFPSATTKAAGVTPDDVAVGDLNGDARPDVVAANEGGGNVAVYFNRLSVVADSDADGVTDSADCAPTDPASWRVPGSVDDLGLSGDAVAVLSWSEPSDPGGHPPRYDVLRSVRPDDFSSAALVLTDGAGRTALDPDVPTAAFFYRVRAENGCDSLGIASPAP